MKILLNNCGKSFHRQWLYRNLNFTFEFPTGNNPQITALLGANGSGKSTFCLMLIQQVFPTEGTIEWQNETGKVIPSTEAIKYCSLASPALELPEELSLQEWFEFHRAIKPLYSELNLDYLIQICQFPKNIKQKAIATFSSGMKQRVKLCAAFFSQSKLLVLDEPLTNLDSKGNELFAYLLTKHHHNRYIIIASNRPDEYRYCTHSLEISNQAIIESPLAINFE